MLEICCFLLKITLATVLTALIGIVTYFKYKFKFWEKCGVPYPTPHIPHGSIADPFFKPKFLGSVCAELYREYKHNGEKHVGMFIFAKPVYIPISTNIIKNIMTRDFQYFIDRGVYYNEKDDPLSAHLFSLEGAKWRNLRVKLTPTFTTGKMRIMFETLMKCGDQLKLAMNKISLKDEPLDIKDILSRFTVDIIGSCAFGLQCNSFEQPQSDFRNYGCRALRPTKLEQMKNFFSFCAPTLSRKLSLNLTPSDVSKFFLTVIKETVDYRETNNVERKDFIQLLINLKNLESDGKSKQDERGITFEELAAQAFVFFIAGFDTSSTALTFCFLELALNSKIQEKVRDEIFHVMGSSDRFTYDSLANLQYTGQVIEEAMRKYPPISTLHRVCVKDYQVPETNVTIKRSTAVIIPILGLHHDPEFFPDPETFDPSRFNPENKLKMEPFAYLPFGEGPRNCIGFRFGVMQMKIALVIMLSNYQFSLNSKTKLPLEFNPYSFVLTTLDDIWLNVSKLADAQDSEESG